MGEAEELSDDMTADVHGGLGLRWAEAFPWIAGAAHTTGRADSGAEPWWLELVSATPTDALDGRLEELSDMALVRMTKWSLGELFPLLPQSTRIELLPFANRARNALIRRGLMTTGDLQAMLLMDLLDLPGVGFGTAGSIMRVLARTCIEQPGSQAYVEQPTLFEMVPEIDTEPPVSLPRAFAEDLQALASWYATLGFTDLPLLGATVPAGTPGDVLEARERLLQLRSADALPGAGADLRIAALLDSELRQLAHLDRSPEILAKRFFADTPQTLEELAGPLELTRERVRQLESKARAQLVRALDGDGSLAGAGAAVRELIGTVLPLGDLLRLVPALGDMVDAVDQPAWRVLDRLDDGYEIEDRWCAAPSINAAKVATQTVLSENGGKHGVVALVDMTLFYDNQRVQAPADATREWFAYCGYVVRDNWIFTRTRSIADWAAGALFVTGSPLSAQEILDRLPVDRSLIVLKNALHGDDRFKRIDRDKWALAEWEGEAYSGIKGQIRQELGRNGGEIAMDLLIERITGQFSVHANSVMAYASNPPFESRGGQVRFATGGRGSKKPLQRTARLYRHDDSLLYRITISTDHLRGSGFPAPVALASELGLQRGTACELRSPLGPQALSWTNMQPAFGSIGSLLLNCGDIGTGQEVFLVIGTDRSFDIRLIDDAETGSLTRAMRLVGFDDTAVDDPLPALARAIDLPEKSPVTSVIGGYRDRGDGDVADLLLASRAQMESTGGAAPADDIDAPDIDDILGLL